MPKAWRDEEHLYRIASSQITDPLALLERIKLSESNNDTVNKTMNSPDAKALFVKCNFCPHDIRQDYLTRHIGMHIENRHIEEANVRVADSVVKNSSSGYQPIKYEPIKQELTKVEPEEVRKFLYAIPTSKVKDTEDFRFRKLKAVSAFSGASKDRRYSDFTFIVWFSDVTSVTSYNSGYAGGSNSQYGKASERLQIHLTYDSLERYYTISGKVYKRTGYSDFETEDGTIPDRICEQEELMVEIKRICLFFKISPMAAYKRFLKTVRKGFSIVASEGTTGQAVTNNHVGILEDLKKAKTTNYSEAEEYQMYC
jgi:hypothetical protein